MLICLGLCFVYFFIRKLSRNCKDLTLLIYCYKELSCYVLIYGLQNKMKEKNVYGLLDVSNFFVKYSHMKNTRELCASFPGLAERLQEEVSELMPSTSHVQVCKS